MVILKRVPFKTVATAFAREHMANRGTNRWAFGVLEKADKFFKGEWYLVALSAAEALGKVQLMWHFHGMRGIELVPEKGVTVSEASGYFQRIEKIYQREDQPCYRNIAFLAKAKLTPVFLCSKPMVGVGLKEHDHMIHIKDALVHLDGAHRLIAWTSSGRIFRMKRVCAYVAGNLG